jgi:hypothetical protein
MDALCAIFMVTPSTLLSAGVNRKRLARSATSHSHMTAMTYALKSESTSRNAL